MARRKKAYTQMPSHVHGEIKQWAIRTLTVSYTVDHDEADKLAEKAERWVTAATELSSRVASVLGRASIPVNWVTLQDPNNAGAIAYTDGESIHLNLGWFLNHVVGKAVSPDSADRGEAKLAWVVFKGIVFHELAHILFTPRQTQKPMPQLKKLAGDSDRRGYEAQLYKAMNILEDSRIESLFTLRYAPAKPVLTAVVREAILDDRNASNWSAALLLHGRKYLPLNVRMAADKAFIEYLASNGREQLAHTILAKIDEYLLLTFPADSDRAIEIIVALADFLVDTNSQVENFDDHGNMKSGKPATPADQREAAAELEKACADDDAAAEEADSADSTDDADDADDDDATDSDADADDSSDGDDSDGDSISDDSMVNMVAVPSDSGSTELAGSGHGYSPDSGSSGQSDLRDEIDLDALGDNLDTEFRQLAEAAVEAEAVSRVPTVAKNPWVNLDRSHGTWPWVAREGLSSKIGEVFFEAQESWVRGHQNGRLNVTDVMSARGQHFDVFDRWVDNSEEATSFEVVVLLDQSGSMNSWNIHNPWLDVPAAQACWAIERAMADHEIRTTIIGFGSKTILLKSAEESFTENAAPLWKSDGGTNIATAAHWATDIFRRSEETNKILLTLTDGQFYANLDQMKALHEHASSVLVRLGCHGGDHHGHQEVVDFGNPKEDLKRLPHLLGSKIISICNEQQMMAA
jgi:hypothetical protein